MKKKILILAVIALLLQSSVFATEGEAQQSDQTTTTVTGEVTSTSDTTATTADTTVTDASNSTTSTTTGILIDTSDIAVTTTTGNGVTTTSSADTTTASTTGYYTTSQWYADGDSDYTTTSDDDETTSLTTTTTQPKTVDEEETVEKGVALTVTGVELAEAKLSKKNITLYGETASGQHYSWVIMYDTIKSTTSDVNLTVKTSDSSVAGRIKAAVPKGNEYVVLSFENNKEFPFEATFAIDVDSSQFKDGAEAYLYTYNRGKASGDYVKNVTINNGIAAFSIDKGNDYFITSKVINKISSSSKFGGLKLQFIFIFGLLIIALLIGFVIYKIRVVVNKVKLMEASGDKTEAAQDNDEKADEQQTVYDDKIVGYDYDKTNVFEIAVTKQSANDSKEDSAVKSEENIDDLLVNGDKESKKAKDVRKKLDYTAETDAEGLYLNPDDAVIPQDLSQDIDEDLFKENSNEEDYSNNDVDEIVKEFSSSFEEEVFKQNYGQNDDNN